MVLEHGNLLFFIHLLPRKIVKGSLYEPIATQSPDSRILSLGEWNPNQAADSLHPEHHKVR